MRKTEAWIGLCAGIIGISIAVLSLFSLLPYSAQIFKSDAGILQAYAYICIAANAAGFIGALLVLKNNIAGAAIMAASMIAIMFFGFPWQSISAMLYIISLVMATVPVKTAGTAVKYN